MTTLHQSILIAKWVNKFNLEDLKQSSISVPQDLKNFEYLVMNTLDDINELSIDTRKSSKYPVKVWSSKTIDWKMSHSSIMTNQKSSFKSSNWYL